MPSAPSSAPPPAASPDPLLVERARRGDQQALAILYARHAPAVHARAVQAGLSPVAAARTVRDVFRGAAADLASPTAAKQTGSWLRGLTMDHLAGPRGPVPRLAPATVAAARGAGAGMSPTLRDAIWRELEHGWRNGGVPLWRRQPAVVAATSAVGLLLAAVTVVGLLVLEQIRPPTTAGAVTLVAQPLEEPVTDEEPPPVAPSVIVPPRTEEPFVPPEEPEEVSPSPVAPSPQPSPTPTDAATEEPSPDPGGSESENPEEPTETPLLPLPGPGGSSEDPSASPSEGTTETEGGGEAAGDGTGDGTGDGGSGTDAGGENTDTEAADA